MATLNSNRRPVAPVSTSSNSGLGSPPSRSYGNIVEDVSASFSGVADYLEEAANDKILLSVAVGGAGGAAAVAYMQQVSLTTPQWVEAIFSNGAVYGVSYAMSAKIAAMMQKQWQANGLSQRDMMMVKMITMGIIAGSISLGANASVFAGGADLMTTLKYFGVYGLVGLGTCYIVSMIAKNANNKSY